MTNAGWYPDPAGAPNTYRYWDGQSWSQQTTTNPPGGGPAPAEPGQGQGQGPAYGEAPPTAFAPVPPHQGGQGGQGGPVGQGGQGGYGGYGGPGAPGGYGQQPWSPTPQGSGGGGSGKVVMIVVAAVVALVLVGVGGFFGVRALTGDDDGEKKADDPTSEATDDTEDPTDSSSATDPSTSSTIRPTGIQCTGGSPELPEEPDPAAKQLTGGGLSIPRLPSYELASGDQVAFSFPDEFVLQYVEVEEKWISLTGVGGLSRDNGFDSVDQAAEIIMQCLTSSDQIYSGFQDRKDVTNEAVTVDGKPGHRITAEIRVDTPEVEAEGDVTDVIVVDTGDADSYGLYIGMATIGRTDLITQNEDVFDSLGVN